jgi:uncharacterized protein
MKLPGWLMTPSMADAHPAVIYFGARSEEVSWVARDVNRMFPGVMVLVVNYRGYGKSHGIPGVQDVDVDTLFDWQTKRSLTAPSEIASVPALGLRCRPRWS